MFVVEYISGRVAREGFGDLFGGWLARGDGLTFLIDTGVVTGALDFVSKIKKSGVEHIDYVLLSHIHLDHAGGLAEVLRAWPEAQVVVHARGINHLVKPERLWQSTNEVMGVLAEIYGKPEPIAKEKLVPHTGADIPGVRIIETLGHAPHHLSFVLGGYVFANEAGGCPYFYKDKVYSRPATPPRYFPEVTIGSIDLLLKEPNGPAFFGHTAHWAPLHEVLFEYKKQLALWLDILTGEEAAKKPGENKNDYLDRVTDIIFEADPNLGPLKRLSGAELWQEKFFMRNSIWGFVRYIEERSQKYVSGE